MLGMVTRVPLGWAEKARVATPQYVHNNPVKRGLVCQPWDWQWSTWRFCHLEDPSILAMDR